MNLLITLKFSHKIYPKLRYDSQYRHGNGLNIVGDSRQVRFYKAWSDCPQQNLIWLYFILKDLSDSWCNFNPWNLDRTLQTYSEYI